MYGLSPEQRSANVRGSIKISVPPEEIRGKSVLLVDDILTTGSTASECARILKTAGARKVTVLVAAMTEKNR
jgi:predicted amidophosphoribosyltransferase